MSNFKPTDLTGHLLVAMPGMEDYRFIKSVIFICRHSPEGAMGIMINKTTGDVAFDDLLKQLEIEGGHTRDIPVYTGGPVEHGRGFVLHGPDYEQSDATLVVDDDFSMTATLDIVEDIACDVGPDQAIFALGYSGWGPGQLEDEILQNGWLTVPATPELVFHADPDRIWAMAIEHMGISPLMLSSFAGHA